MPNAPTHDRIAIAGAMIGAPIAAAGAWYTHAPAAHIAIAPVLWGACHLLSGMLFSPDLDIDSEIDNRWGWLFWIWRPYMWVVPHRHWISHGLIIAPLLRGMYFVASVVLLSSVIAFLAQLAGVTMQLPQSWQYSAWQYLSQQPHICVIALVAWVSAGDMHSIADVVSTARKRSRRRQPFGR